MQWFSENNHSDVVFVDIQLRDGTCFEFLDKIKINSKIVFTTAYSQFALNAFDYNSIDYLLKPIDENKLDKLILKMETLKVGFQNEIMCDNYEDLLQKKSKKSILVSTGNSLKKIEILELICFYSETNSTYILTKENRSFLVNFSLEKLEDELDSDLFFRVNRKFIINKNYIASVSTSKKEIYTTQEIPFTIGISKLKYKSFMEWYKK
jgi:DNA-binding LytR/AlgR family response regulator